MILERGSDERPREMLGRERGAGQETQSDDGEREGCRARDPE